MSSEKKEKAPGKKKVSLVLLAVLVLALLGGGLGVYTYFSAGGQASADDLPAKGKPLLIHGPHDFTVNMSDRAQRRYLKATIALGYAEESIAKELEQRSAQMRDLIISVLRSFSTEDMATPEGVAKLRARLIQDLNAMLTSGEIKEIYFTELLVQ